MRTLLRTSVAVLITFSMAAPAFAWEDPGHLVVAQIAFDNLNDTAKTRVNQLAQQVTFGNNTYNFVTLACWMDDIRDTAALEPLKDWHYITLRFYDGIPPIEKPPPPINVQSILDWSIERLREGRDSPRVQGYTLAYLTHLTGDVHQPLHCSTRYTAAMSGGDLGGNFFRLSSSAIRSNLHSYWDSVGGFFDSANLTRPLNSNERQRIRNFATQIQQDFPKADIANVSDLSPATWVGESHQLARTVVYMNVTPNSVPSNDYRNDTRETTRKRIATAGYRLAEVLNDILGNPSD